MDCSRPAHPQGTQREPIDTQINAARFRGAAPTKFIFLSHFLARGCIGRKQPREFYWRSPPTALLRSSSHPAPLLYVLYARRKARVVGNGQNWPKAPATPARQKQEKSFQQHGNRNSAAARSGNSNLCLWARDINRERARGVCAWVISCSFPAFGGWWWGGGGERGAIDVTGHDRR